VTIVCLAAVPLGAAFGVPQEPVIRFAEVAVEAGVTFRHHDGGTGRRHLPETFGAGVVWIDYDQDGRPDLYFAEGGALPGDPTPAVEGTGALNAMFRQAPDATFALAAGVAADGGYGRGVSAADFDNDGYPDLFVGNWGADVLLRNNGDGTFTAIGDEAGVDDPRHTSSSAWADFNNDGWLDLFVVSYVRYDIATAVTCEDSLRRRVDYCHPAIFDGQKDSLYINRGDGTFDDHSANLRGARDIDGKGLALAVTDLDADGLPDVYVANDTTPNFAYYNRGEGFEENGELTGLGVGDTGQPQAGMGVAVGDVDGDTTMELVVTNFEDEAYNLYRAIAPAFYVDDAYVMGVGGATRPMLGFGVALADYDADGDLDLTIANGHILATAADYAQPNQVFANALAAQRAAAEERGELQPPGPDGVANWAPSGQLFVDVSAAAIATPARVSRGLAGADYDDDGRVDVAITNVNDVAALLRNVSVAGNAITLRLRGRSTSRDAVGAEVWVTPCADAGCTAPTDGTSGYPQRHLIHAGDSYASQGALDVVAGLGAARRAQVTIRWPDGAEDDLGLVDANQRVLVVQGLPPVLAAHRGQR
jgi:hypothetical protein